jgi:hypothetical protein
MRFHQVRTNDGVQGWICQSLETGVELEAPQAETSSVAGANLWTSEFGQRRKRRTPVGGDFSCQPRGSIGP